MLRLLGLCGLFVVASAFVQPGRLQSLGQRESLVVREANTLRGLFDVQSAANLVWKEVVEGATQGKDELDRLRSWVTTKVGVAPEDVMHPVYGELLKDLGFKKLYAATCEQIMDIPLWQKQRTYRPERAKMMAEDIAKRLQDGFRLTLPGVITVFEHAPSGTVGLLDGQHRVGALRILAEQGVLPSEAHVIVTEVFEFHDGHNDYEEEVKRLFIDLNKAQPISLIDVPDMVSDAEKEIISTAAEMLRMEYKDMFKVSVNCRIPHLNIDSLRDELHKGNVVGRLGITTGDQLLEWIKAKNKLLSSKSDADWAKAYRGRNPETIAKAVQKARTVGLFLGLERNWMFEGED